MTGEKKNDYNRDYYLRNKEKILEKARSRSEENKPSKSNVISLFKTKILGKGQPPPAKKAQSAYNWGTLFLQVLVASMIFFMARETALFYAASDESEAMAYFRASILEGVVFAFSMMRSRSGAIGVFYKLMTLLLYSYSIWVISGSVIQTAYNQHGQVAFYEKTISELEAEISKKTALRDSYFSSNRVTLALKMDQALDSLKQKLEQNREALVKSPDTSIIWNTLFTLVAFRILIAISNLFCLQELGRRYRMKLKSA